MSSRGVAWSWSWKPPTKAERAAMVIRDAEVQARLETAAAAGDQDAARKLETRAIASRLADSLKGRRS